MPAKTALLVYLLFVLFFKVEEKSPSQLPTYTSLEEEQVHTIMRSVSMDDSAEDTLENRKKAMSDSQDLFVKVDSPEKHVEGYVSYSVTTQVSFWDWKKWLFSPEKKQKLCIFI